MFSKNNKTLVIVLSIITTIIIFSGFYADSLRKQNYHMYLDAAYETTTPTTRDGVTEVADDSYVILPSENEVTETTASPIVKESDEDIALKMELNEKVQLYATVSRVLFVVGFGLLVFLQVLLFNRKEYLFIEADVLLGLLAFFLLRFVDYSSIYESIVVIPVIYGLIYAIHDVIYWVSHKFTLKATLPYKLGNGLYKGTGKTHMFLVASIITTIVMTVIMSVVLILTISSAFDVMYIFCFVLSVLFWIISIMSLRNYVVSLNHLETQINRLANGEKPEVSNSFYEDTENQISDLIEERNAAIESAVVSERFKVDLITNVSHDLRTPLTSIIGYGELLQNESLSEEGNKNLEQLNKKTSYMRDLVDELFELTKVSSGVIEPKSEEIDLIKITEQTIGLFEDKLQSSNLTVKRHYIEEAIKISTDGAMLHQVLANLIGNAIKYSPVGSRIHITIGCEDDLVKFKISNVSSYEMDFTPEEIVQRFVRGDKNRSTSGSGIGLAIAQTYTDAIGGKFHIEIDDEQFIAIIELKLKDN